MAKLVDPDSLNQNTEVTFNTTNKTIALAVAGNLSNDGVTIQCIYSWCKEEWRTDTTLIKHPFPLKPIDGPSGTQFDLVDGWDWLDATTTGLIRDGGWALKDGSTSQEEWMNVTSLGSFNASTDQAYYTQGDAATPTDITLASEVNQAIKIYGDSSHGNFDYRGDFIIFLREEAKTFDSYDLITEQNISALTYKKYALPLSNASDAIKITHNDAAVALAPYLNINLTIMDGTGFQAASVKSYILNEVGQDSAGRWFRCSVAGTLDANGVADYTTEGGTGTFVAYEGERQIGSDYYAFSKIIEGDNKTLEQIYEKVQYLLRQTTDINENGTGTLRGDTADDLLYFVGDTLNTQTGVFIDNVSSIDMNRINFSDNSGTVRTYPYAAAGTISFNAALQGDASAIYRMYFTNDDAGTNSGNDFGTDNAILVNDNSGTDISGNISGSASVSYDYDYDGNIQRGVGSDGSDVPVTLVAIGLDTAQYVVVTGTISRSKNNNFIMVSSDELTYTNPA